MDSETLKVAVHSIKGLSANIGAIALNEIAKKLETTLDRTFIPKMHEELNRVLEELKELKRWEKSLLNQEVDSKTLKDAFLRLKETLAKMEPLKCEPIINEINNYKLIKKDREMMKTIEESMEEFEFDNAIEMLDKRLDNE